MRISKEIQAFASGKDDAYAWDKPQVSAALTVEQKSILESRGVLDPADIHRLASKVGANDGHRAMCHSDVVSADEARRLQKLDAED